MPGCSSFSIAPAVRLAALSAPLLLAWRCSRRTVVAVTMAVVPVAAKKESSAVLLFVSPAARASAPSRHSDRWTQGACRRTGATGCFCKKQVSAVLLLCFSPVCFKIEPASQRVSVTVNIECCSGRSMDCCLRPSVQRPSRMWPGCHQRPRPRSVWGG